MDSITPVVGGRGRLGLGLGKIRITIQLGKIRTTIPGRVQMSDKAGFQILDTFRGPTHTEKKCLRADITQGIQSIAGNIISYICQNSS